mgnify:CR=1 FL=1
MLQQQRGPSLVMPNCEAEKAPQARGTVYGHAVFTGSKPVHPLRKGNLKILQD